MELNQGPSREFRPASSEEVRRFLAGEFRPDADGEPPIIEEEDARPFPESKRALRVVELSLLFCGRPECPFEGGTLRITEDWDREKWGDEGPPMAQRMCPSEPDLVFKIEWGSLPQKGPCYLIGKTDGAVLLTRASTKWHIDRLLKSVHETLLRERAREMQGEDGEIDGSTILLSSPCPAEEAERFLKGELPASPSEQERDEGVMRLLNVPNLLDVGRRRHSNKYTIAGGDVMVSHHAEDGAHAGYYKIEWGRGRKASFLIRDTDGLAVLTGRATRWDVDSLIMEMIPSVSDHSRAELGGALDMSKAPEPATPEQIQDFLSGRCRPSPDSARVDKIQALLREAGSGTEFLSLGYAPGTGRPVPFSITLEVGNRPEENVYRIEWGPLGSRPGPCFLVGMEDGAVLLTRDASYATADELIEEIAVRAYFVRRDAQTLKGLISGASQHPLAHIVGPLDVPKRSLERSFTRLVASLAEAARSSGGETLLSARDRRDLLEGAERVLADPWLCAAYLRDFLPQTTATQGRAADLPRGFVDGILHEGIGGLSDQELHRLLFNAEGMAQLSAEIAARRPDAWRKALDQDRS